MPTTTRLQAVVPLALATAAASTTVSPAPHETAGSESAASCGPERRAAASFETTSLVWSREVSSSPCHHLAYHYNHPLLLSMFKTTHTPTITTMQSERLVSFQLCILGTMST